MKHSLSKMLRGQPQWVVDQMMAFRSARMIQKEKVPAKGTLTRAKLKEMMVHGRWAVIGAYFNFAPKFLTLPSGKVCFDWASCPTEMADVLRLRGNPDNKKTGRGKSKSYRHLSYMLQSAKCFYCGEPTDFDKWTLDHKTPLCRGGGNGENRIGACYTCNNKKGNMTFEEFLETDYLPNDRRKHLGFPNAPTVKYQTAKNSHHKRLQ